MQIPTGWEEAPRPKQVRLVYGVVHDLTVALQPQPHVLFACLPWRGHLNPLRSIGELTLLVQVLPESPTLRCYAGKLLLAKGFTISFGTTEVRRTVEDFQNL